MSSAAAISPHAIPFRKMNGLGNAFLVFDGRGGPVRLDAGAIRRLGAAGGPAAFDQMIVIEPPSTGADVFMRIYNRDGGEVDACGNATRCVGWLLTDARDSATIDTNAGRLVARRTGTPYEITVDMGEPRFGWRDIPLARAVEDTRAIEIDTAGLAAGLGSPAVASMGNPHVIFWVGDVDAVDLARVGPALEHHPLFPERVNVSLASVTRRDAMTVRTWERGAGLTKACGTAACAAAVSAMRIGRVDRRVAVELPGGRLTVGWESDGHVLMTGPVEAEFEGFLDLRTLAWQRAGS